MGVPDFQTIMLPLLQIAADGKEHSIQKATSQLASHFDLSQAEVNQLLPSGQQTVFYNRVGWARTYLKKSRLIETHKRSFFRITERGRRALEGNPVKIDMKFLQQYEEYREFKALRGTRVSAHEKAVEDVGRTPEEVLEDAYQVIRDSLAQDLLSQVATGSPAFLERLVVELLVRMGYGGSRADAARAVGQSGDEGIDGIIDEDRLGLDTVYIQAKKWSQGTIGRPEIQKFVGALHGKHAKKGIFITTASFSKEAKDYATSIDPKVVLIDGQRLAELMIDYDVGVSRVASYNVKTLDSDYFASS